LFHPRQYQVLLILNAQTYFIQISNTFFTAYFFQISSIYENDKSQRHPGLFLISVLFAVMSSFSIASGMIIIVSVGLVWLFIQKKECIY
jgi:hypothetical protein